MGLALTTATLQPLTAQNNQCQVAGEFVKNVIPVLFDQVKTVSGIDVQSVLRGDQLFEVRDASVLYGFQPDSVHVNVLNALKSAGKADVAASFAPALSGLGVDLTDIPIYYTDHRQITFKQLPLDLNFPTKVTAKSALGDVILTFSWSAADQNLVGPFTAFRCELETTGMLNTLIGATAGSDMDLSWLHNGLVMYFSQYMGEKGPEIALEFGDVAKGIYEMTTDETDIDYVPMDNVWRKHISMDMSTLQTEGYYTRTTSIEFNDNPTPVKVEEAIYEQPFKNSLEAKRITSISYDYQTGLPTWYTQETTEIETDSDENGDFVYKVEKLYAKQDADAEWGDPVAQDSMRIQAANMTLDKNQVIASLITAFNDAMQNGVSEDGVIWGVGNFEYDNTLETFVPKNTKALYMFRENRDSVTIVLDVMKPYIEEGDDEYSYETTLRWSAGFNKAGEGMAVIAAPDEEGDFTEEGLVSTIFYHSNLMDNVANEKVIQAPELKIVMEADQLRFEGSETTMYRIYNILGAPVKAGQGSRVSLADLERGHVYVVIATDGDKRAVMRFVK